MSKDSRRPSSTDPGRSPQRGGSDPRPPTSHGPSGSARQGRRERTRYTPARRSFFERHRGVVLGLIAVAALVLVGGFVAVQAAGKAYACASLTDPAASASPLTNGSPAPLGQVQPDMGRNHVADGAVVRYTYCPPASGNHYNSALGPIQPRYYGPNDATVPEGWVHNLEHGAIVILYSCGLGACDDATQQQLQTLAQTFPDSPICKIPRGQISPVVTRFEDMKAPIAALVWGRVMFQQKLDTAQIIQFFNENAEIHNPEQQCTKPSPGASTAPAASPAGSPSASPAASGSPAASASPVVSASPAASTSPSSSPSSAASPTPAPSPS